MGVIEAPIWERPAGLIRERRADLPIGKLRPCAGTTHIWWLLMVPLDSIQRKAKLHEQKRFTVDIGFSLQQFRMLSVDLRLA